MSTTAHAKRSPTTLPEEQRLRVLSLVRVSERHAVAALGVSRATVCRLVAGLPVQAGTLALVREAMQRLLDAPVPSCPEGGRQ